MQGIGALMLRVLINRFHHGRPEPSLKCLPNQLANQVLHLETRSVDTSPFFEAYGSVTEKIHYSWLIPAIKKFPEKLQEAVISVLSKQHQASLRRDFPMFKRAVVLPKSIKRYFLELIYIEVKPLGVVLPQFLPETELSRLTSKSKNELVDIIDFLGLFDLAETIRQIVDKKQLKRIYGLLTPMQTSFIGQTLQAKPRLVAPPLPIANWSGEKKEFEQLVHRRGLARFAKALSGQHPDFIWYIAHILDKGRGNIVMKSWSENETPNVTPILIQQLETVEAFLAQENIKKP